MKSVVKAIIVSILSTLVMSGCSGSPDPKNDPYSDADSQRTRADKAQGELSSDTGNK